MTEIHKYAGYLVVALFALGWIWGGLAWMFKRDPGDRFWIWVTTAQIVSGIQALVGIVVFMSGYRALTMLHYAYGLFPVLALGVAHAIARRRDFRDRPWIPFAWVAFICFGLALRALMTGLGS